MLDNANMDKVKVKVLSLFDGISSGRIALERAGINVGEYYASEVDKNAIKVSKYNWPNIIQLGSVTEIDTKNLGKIDLLIAGAPCTNFSFAGKQKGMSTKDSQEILTLDHYLKLKSENYEFEGQSYLFWEFVRILKEVKPKYFLLENVRMAKKWQDVISGVLGVGPIMINSARLSAQNRVRNYWVNLSNVTQPEDKGIMLKDVIHQEYDGIWVWPRGENKGGVQSYKGKSPSLTTSSWEHNFLVYKGGALRTFPRNPNGQKRAKNLELRKDGKSNCLTTHPLDSLLARDGEYRKFTPEEAEVLQTVPKGYTSCISNHQRYRCLGNGWTVDVIAHILRFLPEEYKLASGETNVE